MPPFLEIRLLPSGAIEAKTEGLYGDTCLKALPLLEKIVPGQIQSSQWTQDYQQTQMEFKVGEDVTVRDLG